MGPAVSRTSQNLLVTLLGGAVLWVSLFTTSYLNYVKPGFRWFLVAAGVVLVVLGVVGILRDRAGHAPRVAWLLTLPVFAILLIAPPPLGSDAASRSAPRPAVPVTAYKPLNTGLTAMSVGEFVGRAWDGKGSLTGRQVALTGFVVPGRKGAWYVARMQMNCCAADAFALKVLVRGVKAPPRDTWVEVTGTWIPPKTGGLPKGTVPPELAATTLRRLTKPDETYE
ncbi:TIGR03943 family putative permease subunit [Bailinhaonella thermotolerans]|uniref:TIGR03943 family protein n=1 Tax=Bailinhaonella thermotolerans TaxID=1070861 RepID=A0A3A4B4E0_9ACTN|nr:TIGR03943 family protein [Bailinhaonella thermotolerans]RJL32230.1 TIGR03943 family protein [Bailinhaonella thermotolerans]